MDSSDDEGEKFPAIVSEYYFTDGGDAPISFAALPVCWNTDEAVQSPENKIYVRGKTNNGLENFYKSVKAWKFDISGEKPEISVLLEDNNWIKLQKPRNVYEEFSRTVLITVYFLRLVKRNPESHGKFLWDKLSKIFRLLEEKPSPDDLVDHKALIEKAVEHHDSLKKSKYLTTFLEKNFQKENRVQENARSKGKNAFIVDDDDGSVNGKNGSVDTEDGSDSEEDDDDIFDSVCCICDEGGSILCCDGICTRSFHATRRAAKDVDSKCISLGFSTMEVDAMRTFKCQNCQYKLHQCYSCGVLGSSDKESGAKVFQCVNATCGYFYHPGCVAKQLHLDNVDAVNALEKDIAAGEAFTCPLHMCVVCKQPENKADSELQMAVCRRCPTAYHAKCLPREIALEADEDEGIIQRAWDGLLVDRILIYCLKHEIDEDLGTPSRDHIKFPGDNKKEKQPLRQQRMKHKAVPQYKKPPVKDLSRQGPAFEPKKSLLENQPSKSDGQIPKPKGIGTLRKLSVEKKSVSTEVELKSSEVELKSHEQLDLVKPSKFVNFAARKPVLKLDSDSETRVLQLIEEASSKITLDEVTEKHRKLIPTHAYKQRGDPCKGITKGKVERSCTGIQEAVRKLKAGGSIEEAKAMCDPKTLDQVLKWQTKLRVYLSPFLHGMSYTSFGRHFTKIGKLKEIVDKLHWYVNNNDTVVDFCCGSNDFSYLMKQKLDSVGKTCNYKNYDIFPPKNDFNFEKRDWMSVQPKELPCGSQLIMGLNPPFGVKGCFANQFINKALQFKPKIIILIVPPETEELNKKKTPYDLVWEDRHKLIGEAFYIPGSRDKNNKQVEDWNNSTSILSLWSRPDWTARHKNVAKTRCHVQGERDSGNYASKPGSEQSSDKCEQVAVKKTDDVSGLMDDHQEFQERAAAKNHAPLKDDLGEMHASSAELTRKRHSEETNAKDIESPREYKRSRSSPFNPHHEWPHHSPVDARGSNLSSPLTYQKYPAHLEIAAPAYEHSQQSTGYGDMSRRFEIPGSYSDRVRFQHPQTDIHRVDYPPRAAPPGDYFPRNPGEWDPGHPAYMRGPDSYVTNQPIDPAYSRMAPMSVIDKYCPRLDEQNHGRMSAYVPDLGHPSEPRMYDHYDPRQGYHGAPIVSVPRSVESFPMVSTSKDSKMHGKGKKKKAKDGAEQKCFHCNESGHFKRDCYKYKEDAKTPKRGM